MTGRSLLGTVLTVASLVSIVLVFLVPPDLKTISWVLVGSLIVANFAHRLWGFRDERRAGDAVVRAHAGQTSMRAGLAQAEGVARPQRARVVAVIADRSGLTFRDRSDLEVLHIAASQILSLELAPLDPRRPLRPAVVTLLDGAPVSFWMGVRADDLAEAIVGLRTALGR